MKKEYMKPAMRVVRIQHQCIICTSPAVHNSVGGSTQFSRSSGGWDDDE